MNREQTLRGRGAFASLYRDGTRLEGNLLRLFFRSTRGAGTQVRAGFSVSARLFNAVARNRMRRLMRVAFELEKEKLRMHDGALGKTLEILFVFKGSSGILPSRVSLEDIQREMANLCHRILW